MTLDEARRDIADASRILAAQGVLDAFGHVSRRSPEREDRFLISRTLAPALVTGTDVLELEFGGVAVTNPTARLFVERFLHAEIYRRRRDVNAIVHSHAPAVVPFTVVRAVPLRPVCHTCGFLHGTPNPFDVADHAGDATDLLVRDTALGGALAEHLGEAAVVTMRGHGFTVVGKDVAEATFRAVYTVRNCEMQTTALLLGEPTYLTAGEARACEATTAVQSDRAWDLWRREVTQQAD